MDNLSKNSKEKDKSLLPVQNAKKSCTKGPNFPVLSPENWISSKTEGNRAFQKYSYHTI